MLILIGEISPSGHSKTSPQHLTRHKSTATALKYGTTVYASYWVAPIASVAPVSIFTFCAFRYFVDINEQRLCMTRRFLISRIHEFDQRLALNATQP